MTGPNTTMGLPITPADQSPRPHVCFLKQAAGQVELTNNCMVRAFAAHKLRLTDFAAHKLRLTAFAAHKLRLTAFAAHKLQENVIVAFKKLTVNRPLAHIKC